MYPLVKIEWVDAEADNSWVTDEDIDGDGVGDPVVTVGYLVRKPTRAKPMYTVAGTIANDSKLFNNVMKIPKAWVKSVTFLEK